MFQKIFEIHIGWGNVDQRRPFVGTLELENKLILRPTESGEGGVTKADLWGCRLVD